MINQTINTITGSEFATIAQAVQPGQTLAKTEEHVATVSTSIHTTVTAQRGPMEMYAKIALTVSS